LLVKKLAECGLQFAIQLAESGLELACFDFEDALRHAA